ncbi:PIG-L deacetylase family protein [Chloroflexota bacterium]
MVVAKNQTNQQTDDPPPQQELGIWDKKQIILVILAHPDDPEFFCGATLAKWIKEGHEVHYFLLTCGDKGSTDPLLSEDQICKIRHDEQLEAAKVIGVSSVKFHDAPDGYLLPTLELRREVVRAIRKVKPHILVTCDPTNLFPNGSYRLNHADHRYAGQVVLDAVFPAAGNIHFFPELHKEENLEPHSPNEVWISLTSHPDVILDVTETWEIKLEALLKHKSQIGKPEEFIERIKSWRSPKSTENKPIYEERFRLIKWK